MIYQNVASDFTEASAERSMTTSYGQLNQPTCYLTLAGISVPFFLAHMARAIVMLLSDPSGQNAAVGLGEIPKRLACCLFPKAEL